MSSRVNSTFDPSRLSSAASSALHAWRSDPEFAPWRTATEAMLSGASPAEIEDAFGTVLSFGTGGMRGPCGPGPGRMNGWVVARASQGLADYLRARPALPASIVVGCDARRDSPAFAEITARTLAASGLTVHLHEGLVSTPQLCHAVRALGVGAGVMITASHNPPSDNGYKCYQAAGHQFAPPEDAELVACVQRATPPSLARLASLESLRAAGRVRLVPPELRERYLDDAVRASRLEAIPATARAAVSVLYSPYHGVGTLSVLPALRRAGFRVRLLECQAQQDGRFPTLPGGVANPEEPTTFWRLLCAATDTDDLLLASDPDADRIGAMVRGGPGSTGTRAAEPAGPPEWYWLDGQRLMALLADFAARNWAAARPSRVGVVSRSLVTTGLADAVVRAAGVAVVEGDFLVGLKYTGRLIAELDTDPQREFVFGGEEAHGYISGSHVRDKDAANAACLLAGLVAECKCAGRSVWSHLLDLYRRHGVYGHAAGYLSLSPADGGQARAGRILALLRRHPPSRLAGRPVLKVIDYCGTERTELDLATGRAQRRPADPGNVLVYVLSANGEDRLTVRPSGTEPKMKLYTQVVRPVEQSASDAAVESVVAAAEAEATGLLSTVIAELRCL